MNSEIAEIIGTNDITVDARSFSWAVDSAIRSRNASNLGVSPVHSFASIVDSAIRSRTPSNLGTSSVRSFASAVDYATEHVAARMFTRAELKAATNNFSLVNMIGAGSLAVVYRGKIVDGREVAIKRGGTGFNIKGVVVGHLLSSLTHLHHKHLVRLVGFCEEKGERLLVYEYMKNGALYDHLHGKKGSSVLNSWKMRIKIALDASRGIQYLHNYADPSTIHRDIKSSNILLDATWTARVSDFVLPFMKNTVGTVGYLDPQYYRLNVLTTKSDVYGLGVVLLELLTGNRPIFKSGEDGGIPLSVVDFAVPAILAGELVKILDPRVGPPNVNEAEAVKLVAYTAIHCVSWEGKDRPTVADIVINLERAFGYL